MATIDNIPTIYTAPEITNEIKLYKLNNYILVCGNETYQIKDDLKSLGGSFDSNIKCWKFNISLGNNIYDYLENKRLELKQFEEKQKQLEKERKQKDEYDRLMKHPLIKG